MRLIRFRRFAARARLFLADGFADEGEIAQILRAGDAARHAAVPLPTAKHDTTGFSFEMPVEGNPALRALAARIEAAFGFPNRQGETMRFRRYGPGESHPPHTDCYAIDGMHLVATALLWLLEPERGGETRFPFAGEDGEPIDLLLRRGRLAMWLNDTPAGEEDRAAVHQGLPVLAGAKTTITSFHYAPPGAVPAFAAALAAEHGLDGVRCGRRSPVPA